MADPIQLAKALEGVRAWNGWYSIETCSGGIDLSGVDFSGQDLRGINWNYMETRPMNHFEGCDFSNCNFGTSGYDEITYLNGGIFTNANFTNCNLCKVALHYTVWDNANLSGAIFGFSETDAIFVSHADFSRALNVPSSLLWVQAKWLETTKLPSDFKVRRAQLLKKAKLRQSAESLSGIVQFLKGEG